MKKKKNIEEKKKKKRQSYKSAFLKDKLINLLEKYYQYILTNIKKYGMICKNNKSAFKALFFLLDFAARKQYKK